MSIPDKIGNTDRFVFSILGQICAFTAGGGEIIVPTRLDTCKLVPISIVSDFGNTKLADVEVREALLAISRMITAIGKNEVVSVENLSVQDEDEVKYIVTIKKQPLSP